MPYSSQSIAKTAALSLAIALSVLLTACEKHAEPPPVAPGPSVNGETVRFPGRVDGITTEAVQNAGGIALSLPGRLIWDEDRTVRVQAPFAGRVVRPMAAVGDTVRAGQAIAEMSSPEFSSAIAEARSADNELRLAQDNLNRVRELHDAGIVSLRELRQAQSDEAGKTIEKVRAQTRLNQLGAVDGPTFFLRAPIAGVVVERAVNTGQEFRPDSPGSPLFVITDPTRLWVRLDATEADLIRVSGVALGTPIAVVSAAYPTRKFPGTLAYIGDTIDAESRTFRLRGSVPNPERLLKGEMFVTASFPVPTSMSSESLHNLPSSAVMLVGGKHFVFVVEPDGGFTRKQVKITREIANRIEVQGLIDGQRVVTEGNLFLQQIVAEARAHAPAPATVKSNSTGKESRP